MAIKASELDQDIRESFELEDGTIDNSVERETLTNYLHQSQDDSFGGEESSRVKKFFDYLGLHVFLPWLKAVTKALNALKSTVETEYLKKEEVQDTYGATSEDPISGKGVNEALVGLELNTVWNGIKLTGCYLEVADVFAISTTVKIMRLLNGGGDIDAEGEEANDKRFYGTRIFVRDTTNELLYFVSAQEVLRVCLNEIEAPAPILDLQTVDSEALKTQIFAALFPQYEAREDITDSAGYFALPSDQAKVEIEFSEDSDVSYFYILEAETFVEPAMYFREGATSPYVFPDDFADQEKAARYWKEGNYLEASGATKATLITTKEQTDKTALSKSRMLDILLNEATETVTAYIPVARFGGSFVLTSEMLANGLYIRYNGNVATGEDMYLYRDIYAAGDAYPISEMNISIQKIPGELQEWSEISSYTAGCIIYPYYSSDKSDMENVEIVMPITMEYVSKDKLAQMLGSSGGGSVSSSYGLISQTDDGSLQIS